MVLRYMGSLSRERKTQMFGLVFIWLIDVFVISLAAAYLLYSSDAFLVLSSLNMLFYLGIYLTFKVWAGRNGFPSERLTWVGLAFAVCVCVCVCVYVGVCVCAWCVLGVCVCLCVCVCVCLCVLCCDRMR